MHTFTFNGSTFVEHALTCPDCGSPMQLVKFMEKVIYRCTRHEQTNCQGCHGAHPDGRPLGTPAHWTVRALRKQAHGVFDQLWQGAEAKMTRSQAYAWLGEVMGLSTDEAHVSKFDGTQCERLLTIVRETYGIEPAPDLAAGRTGFYEVGL